MHKKPITDLLRTNQTVFSFKEVALIWGDTHPQTIKAAINYYVRTGALYSIRKGFYAKDKSYDKFELATKIYTPSYISFETVLGPAGITFQYYNQIFVASYLTRDIVVDQQTYSFRKIKDSILIQDAGIQMKGNKSMAVPERAFLDVLYLNKDYHFDNLTPLNWEKVFQILPIYGDHKRMKKTVTQYYKNQKRP
jgi:hypothetical protein